MSKKAKPAEDPKETTDPGPSIIDILRGIPKPAEPAEAIVPEYGVSMEEISRRQRPAESNPLL